MSNVTYERVNWEDSPSENTPINQTNLNKMDKGIADCAAEINNLNETVANLSHVGQIIMSTTLSTEASVIAVYGGSQWVKIEGKFLLGASSSHAVRSTGGSETVTLTVNQIPSHSHTYESSSQSNGYYVDTPESGSGPRGWSSKASGATGGGQPHENMPPFIAVYIWERIA